MLTIVSVLAVTVPTLIVQASTAPQTAPPSLVGGQPIVPPQQLPPVDPIEFAAITPDDARRINTAVPFSVGPNPAAKPFRLQETGIAAMRAVDCLATAVLYEAGDDATGQRAVAQVIINRVRHPAFPKTICGVVFQGAERRTGCQFTFTCDGALFRHRWSDEAWVCARTVATEALKGRVFAKVGHSTHYHTDWVVPYWSSSLDKVSAVGTHLFFRWTGWWGTPPAFNRRVATDEPIIALLAQYSPAHNAAGDFQAAAIDDFPAEAYVPPAPVSGDPNAFLATVDRRTDPDSFRKLAEASCGSRPYCKYMAWTARLRTPTALPLEPVQVATMSFSYLRDRARGFEKALWSCSQFPRADQNQCMKAQTFVPGTAVVPTLANAPDALGVASAGTTTITRAASDDGKAVGLLPPPAALAGNKPKITGSFQPATPTARPTVSPPLTAPRPAPTAKPSAP
ncbi:cell wall hydrolase [Sphingomonas sp. 28-62-11]|uniref:cell wall hydrolase n=1 Tax=Sphingomonas sp. 28-62-11 TaxID=1970432 RepID=UPI000BDDA85D|nr:MAG: cell wall hydrolase [Sphingomonas sp. 28-62-11]